MPRRMMPAPRCPRRPGSEAFRPHGGQQHREWKDVATVVEPAVAKCLNPGLREVAEEDLTEEGGRTFFVVRKRPEGAAVKYWRSSQDTQLHV